MLTTEYARACVTTRDWTGTVAGSNGATHVLTWERDYSPNRTSQYRYTCTCKGFQFRGTCKHVKAAYDNDLADSGSRHRCGWNARWDAEEVNPDDSCPCCGSDTFTYAYGA